MPETKDLLIERTLPARVSRVWMAWTEPDMVAKWWSPFPNAVSKVEELEVTPGGTAKILATDPQGGAPLTFFLEYHKVVPPKELSFTVRGGEDGPESPEMRVRFEPEENGEETKMIFESPRIPAEAFEDASGGWQEFFDKLEDSLTGESPDLLFEGGEGMSIQDKENE